MVESLNSRKRWASTEWQGYMTETRTPGGTEAGEELTLQEAQEKKAEQSTAGPQARGGLECTGGGPSGRQLSTSQPFG